MTSFSGDPIIPGGINGHFDNVEPSPSHSLSQTATLNGHGVTSNIDQDPKIEQCHSVASKALSWLSQELKLAVGLILIAGAVVAFIALSPKLLALAIAVTAVAATIGIVALASALYTGASKSSKNEAFPKGFQSLVKKEFITSLEPFLTNQSIPEAKKTALRDIKNEISTFLSSTNLTNAEAIDKLNYFREKIVEAIIGKYPEFNEIELLANLDFTIDEIEIINIFQTWLRTSLGSDAYSKKFALLKLDAITFIFHVITKYPDRVKDINAAYTAIENFNDILDEYQDTQWERMKLEGSA